MRLLLISAIVSIIALSCKSKEVLTNEDSSAESRTTKQADRANRGDRKGPPSIDEVFQMDVNNDEKLSVSELANSPLAKHFSTIDSNDDGFISKEEFINAPKPQRGKRPTKNN